MNTYRYPVLLKLTSLLLVWQLQSAIALAADPPPASDSTAIDRNESNRSPNIVLIFIDDLGYGDINAFAKNPYPTPHLDRLAKEGRRFTDFVVSSAVCSASRAALMTGCYHVRVGISGALGPNSRIGISDAEVTLAEVCKSKGYATACYGKWHLGDKEPFLPHHHGFDDYYGLPYSNDMWPLHPQMVAKRKRNPSAKADWPPLPLIEAKAGQMHRVVNADVQPADQEQLTQQYTERATQFIRANRDRPFFVYLPHSMVHVPLYVSDAFRGRSGAGLFGDVMMEVDWSVGEILNTLDELELSRKTLVIFTSDNGPWLSYGDHAGHAGPLREGKGTMFEGGYRVPTIMRWAGADPAQARIPAGTECNQLCSTIDILPTVAGLLDAELPNHPIDGHNITGLMFGDPQAKSPHTAFCCYYERNALQAIRNERWKLHFPHSYRTLGGRPGGTNGQPVNYETHSIGMALYDLENDVAETRDLAAEHPEIVAELSVAAGRVRASLGDSLQPTVGKDVRAPGQL